MTRCECTKPVHEPTGLCCICAKDCLCHTAYANPLDKKNVFS